MKTSEHLLIIGAGPKALAIAAKNEVLASLGLAVPQIHILEKHVVGAHWTGRHGHTSGDGLLGTLPDKDIGFPYRSERWGDGLNRLVDARMRAYSWSSFLVATGRFAEWIDRGRPAPSHRRWSEYLQWVSSSLGPSAQVHIGEATTITLREDRFCVTYRDPQGRLVKMDGDGLVMTGPGEPRWPCPVRQSDRVFAARDLWTATRRPGGGRVAIIGAGEAAAAAVLHILERQEPGLFVDIISPVGAIHSRGESYLENRIYSDPAAGHWRTLSLQDRRRFILRTDRGVFSSQAHSVLNDASNVGVVPGRVRAITEDREQVGVEIEYEGVRTRSRYDQVIVAMGTDPLSLLCELLDARSAEEILRQTGLRAIEEDLVEERIGDNLELVGLSARLHLPALAGVLQGPGFANLSCLGRLSDLVLSAYLQVADRPEPHAPTLPGPPRSQGDKHEPFHPAVWAPVP